MVARVMAILLVAALTIVIGSALTTAGTGCAGDACDVVKIRWDEEREGYLIKNQGDREVKVEIQQGTTAFPPRCLGWKTYYVDPGEKAFCSFRAHCDYRANYT